jgi:RHS repeat-associated protein
MANTKYANCTLGIRTSQFHPISMLAICRFLFLLGLGIYSLSSWAAVTTSPVLISDQVSVRYSGLRLNRATNTFDTLATFTNTSNNDIQTPIQLVIDSISTTGISLTNADGVLVDGRRYMNVPVANNHLLPGKTVTGVLLKFSNPKRVSFSFRHSVLGVLPASNHPPIAHAGENRSVTINTEVSLSAVASSDEDGDSLTYRWQLLEKPTGSTATLSNANTLQPQFTVDLKGSYRIELIVNDGQIDSQPAYVTISTENSKPIANAGADQTVKVQQTALLDGSTSTDVDNDPLSFLWELLTKPSNSQTTLNNANSETPNLTPDKPGSYTVQLKVNDGQLDSAPDQVIINTENSKPVANAGPNQTAQTGDNVTLDGRLSSDVDSDPLSHVWSLLSKPANSQPELKQHDQVQAILTPDLPGDYVAQLIVNDSKLNSEPATSLITVSAKPPLNHAPQITSSANTKAVVAALYQYDVDASDANNDALTYSLTAYPTGMSINSQIGLISWTPAANQLGSQSVNVQVSDGKGGSDGQSFSITVSDVPQATVPNLIDQNRADAIAAIQQAKLNLGSLSFQHSNQADGKVISQSVTAGSVVKLGAAVNLTISLGPDNGLPPNPATVAPILDPTVSHNVYDSTQFLYAGSNPIQTGVQPGTIELKRAAVMRGRVLDKQNNPLSGVTITIKDHPEFGQTLSRADGWFDMAVNGGGYLTLNYKKANFLPVQRQLNVPWQDFKIGEDVVMIGLDSQVTEIDLANSQIMQVAQGGVVTDKDGSRQATVLFPQGTTASMTLPDGTSQPLNNLHVRATEYTVGENGPKTMPAPLPPTSGYTYAVELSADEAIAAGAKDVQFNQQVPFYVDNFIGFPVGMIAPVGWYDSQKGAWIPSDNGTVIKIVGESNGLADIDSNGDGQADNELSLGDTERTRLAELYEPGKTLWRVPLQHFSPWDVNWAAMGPPQGAQGPDVPLPESSADENNRTDDPDCVNGSIIECENQTIGESIPISGTPFTLNYRSDRMPGRITTLTIPLTGETVPIGVKRVVVTVSYGGQQVSETFSANPKQFHTMKLLNANIYGNASTAKAEVSVGYVYDGVYYFSPESLARAFGSVTGVATTIPSRQEVLVAKVTTVPVEFNSTAYQSSLAGWGLNILHHYDPLIKVLFRGDGSRVSSISQEIGSVITTVAGNGAVAVGGDGGGLATETALGVPRHISAAADGSLYIATNNRIRRLDPNGLIVTVAGNGVSGFNGDGGLATQASLNLSGGIAVASDGSLYIADSGSHRIRRVDPKGIISTIAGNGNGGFSGDGGPATDAALNYPGDVAVAADGSLFICDSRNFRIRRISPDGIISTIAGNGNHHFTGDGGPATGAAINPSGLAIAADGSVYFSDWGNSRIRRIGLNGLISTVAGNGIGGFSGDGGPATAASISLPLDIDLAPDGSLYIAEQIHRIRRVDPEGNITTVAGSGTAGFGGDGFLARRATLNGPFGVAVAADGSLYIAEHYNFRIRRIASSLPGLSIDDTALASEDGKQIYFFDGSGRHTKTIDSLTGGSLYEFDYDSKGRISRVIDSEGKVTSFGWEAAGKVTIDSPFSQRTWLDVNDNGYLGSVANPADERYAMSYDAGGLLTQFRTPRGPFSSFSYDPDTGRLVSDEDALGGRQTLSTVKLNKGIEVTRNTPHGLKTRYRLENLNNRDNLRTITAPDSTRNQTLKGTDGSSKVTLPDGTQIDKLLAPDPRFGMLSPVIESVKTATGGLVSTVTTERLAVLTNKDDPLSLTKLTENVSINGRTSSSVYTAADKTTTATSAAGRVSQTVTDNIGRVTESRVTGLETVKNSYDTHGRLASVSQGSGANERLLNFAYNDQGYLASVTDPLGRSVAYQYDLAGRVTQQTLPDGNDILFSYDANGNLLSLTPPGKPAHHFAYDKIDQQTLYTPPDVGAGSNSTQYSYNLDKQLTQIARPDGLTLDFAYDNAGRLKTLITPDGATAYSYDAVTGKLVGIDTPAGNGLDYAFNGALLTSTTWSGAVAGKVGFAYDNDFRVTGISLNDADSVAYQYDADSLLTQAGALSLSRSADNGLLTGSSLGSISDSLSYNGFGELSQYAASHNGSDLLKFSYTRDKLGRISHKKEMRGSLETDYDYAYDSAGRLAEVRKNNLLQARYSYDANGNRLQYQGSSTINATYDAQDRLLTYGNASYQYTANGELKSKTVGTAVTQYQYDVLGNLKQVKLPAGKQIDYLVDGQNRRIGKKVNGTLQQAFLWQDQLKPIAELDGSGNLVSRFVYATRVNVPDYMVRAGVTYRIVTDHIGSPRLVVRASDGVVVQRMEYDEFGRVLDDTNPGFQPFGFAGGLYDRDTGLVRFGARDYDALMGRWLSKDSVRILSELLNTYKYSQNDSINWSDANGLRPGRSYRNEEQAARAASNDIYSDSIRTDSELGGMIYRNADGSYSYTSPNNGGTGGVDPGGAIACPVGTRPVGYYHSHGANNPNYLNETFSGTPSGSTHGDIPYANRLSINGYVVTPSGNILQYDRANGTVRDIGSTNEGYRRGR